jgi:MarR family transcriptional regulator, organic hydroperoxide resistance regulator
MAGYPQLELDRQLCFALYTASRAVVRAYAPLLDDVGLTYPQYVTMLVLWQDPDRPRSIGELGERLHLDSGTLTPLLKRLTAAGYVTRSRDAEDERRVLVTLTAQGLALRDRLAAVPESFLACLDMDAPAATALRDQLVALTAALEAAPAEAPAGPLQVDAARDQRVRAAADPDRAVGVGGDMDAAAAAKRGPLAGRVGGGRLPR